MADDDAEDGGDGDADAEGAEGSAKRKKKRRRRRESDEELDEEDYELIVGPLFLTFCVSWSLLVKIAT